MSAMSEEETRAALRAAGYRIGSYADFLGLTDAEAAEVEARSDARGVEASPAECGAPAPRPRARRAKKF